MLCTGCESAAGSVQRPTLRFGTGTALGRDFVAEFSRHLPGVELRMVDTRGSVGTVDALRRGQVDLGIVTADVAYFAERQSLGDADVTRHITGISVTSVVPLHVVARRGLNVRSIADLQGRSVGIGAPTAGSSSFGTLIMKGLQVESKLLHRASSIPVDTRTELRDVAAGVLDAAIAVGYDPMPEVTDALTAGAQLVSVEGPLLDSLRQHYPFIRLISIPAGTYPNQPAALHTIGTDTILVCLDDIDERLAYDLTAAFFITLPEHMSKKPWSGRYLDWDRASATPIPLHPGAARYYREQELSR
jgi:TRAP transporter TAXI family solute receptor